MIQQMLAIWSPVPLPFLKPAWYSWFTYCWRLSWRILSITLLVCEMNAIVWNFPGGSDSRASAYNVGDPVSIPGWWRSPGEGNGNPLQYSCLENPMGSQRVRHDWATSLHFTLSILWHHLSLGLEWKLTFSSPMATAGFSKFADILSATFSQHHLLGFEIAQLEFHHLH